MKKHLIKLIYGSKEENNLATVITSLDVDEADNAPIICLLAAKADAKIRETVTTKLGKLTDYRYLGIEDEVHILLGDDE